MAPAVERDDLTAAEAEIRAAAISDPRYRVHLDLTGDDDTAFRSHTSLTFSSRDAGDTFVDLSAVAVRSATLDGAPLPEAAIRPHRILLTELPDGAHELEVVADVAYQNVGKGMSRFRDPGDGRVYLHSQFEPFGAHTVFPCFDQPDLKGTFDVSVDAPEDWVVVSNAPVADRPEPGSAGRWTFETGPLIPPYLAAVVAGAYAEVEATHGDLPTSLYVRRSLADSLDADEILGVTRQGLDWFPEAFDQPYPFAKYDQLFVPEFQAGAMENPGCVTFSETYVFRSKVTEVERERRAGTILHEMAHMWFGDLVTMRWWNDLWLKESFADFAALLAQVEATRFRDAWVSFLLRDKAWAKYQDQLPTTHPIVAEIPSVESVHQNFDGITYAKGAAVLRQLVAWVGQDDFLTGCQRYFAKHAWGNTTFPDLLAALESVSDRDDLAGWSAEWLQTSGVDTLEADLDGETVVVRRSSPGGTPRRHRIAVAAFADRGGVLVEVGRRELDVADDEVVVPDLPPGDVRIVNADDLTYAKLRLDAGTVARLDRDLPRLEEPLDRAQVWGALWDGVRDANLAASRFVEIVVAVAPHETHVNLLMRILQRAVACADRYADPLRRDDLCERLHEVAVDGLHRSPAGSELQLVWARHLPQVSRTASAARPLLELLDGHEEIDGLVLDAELRWAFITGLAGHGLVDEARIEQEFERDGHRDLAERHRATAMAARPEPEAKARAWSQLVDEKLSLTMARQVWTGLHRPYQPELAARYVEPFFDALDDIWATRPLDWAIEFTESAYPHPAVSDELLERTDEALTTADGPRSRALREQRDEAARVLAARRFDAEG